MATTVTAKGQVTIPKQVRDLMGIGPGSKVEFRRSADGSIVLVLADKKRPKAGLPGCEVTPGRDSARMPLWR